ncbi:MAG: 50S ribosomal protein L18 [Promethearchaeota archaeon]|nr:MAG: 50S ribosomal protein L18 [Candidatus Lokiarchaeota archaeon]
MATGPRYRVPFRRRKEGKTNYYRRLKLLKSRRLRAVIRVSSNHTRVQIIKSKFGGDEILVSAYSKELSNGYAWEASTSSLPAAYLTGYLAGIRAKENDINDCILDIGLFYHKNRVLAAFKGLIDAGLEIPHREEFFPESLEERYNGSHIEEYAKLLNEENPEKYEEQFSGYLKKKIDPRKMTSMFDNTLKKIKG